MGAARILVVFSPLELVAVGKVVALLETPCHFPGGEERQNTWI
jgi:hypothetical protein